MKIVSLIGNLSQHKTKRYKYRPLAAIRSIAIHHSATKSGSAEAFARYHVQTLEWPGVGYHYVISKDGTVYKCHPLTLMTYHVGGSNREAVGICLVGDYDKEVPPDVQLEAAAELVKTLRSAFPWPLEVKRHGDYPGYKWKSCPGRRFPWPEFKALLR